MKNINTSTITTSVTETVSKSISSSSTSGYKRSLETAIKTAIPRIGELSVKLNLETSKSFTVSSGKTTTTSVNHIEQYVQSEETSRTMTFGSNGAPAGYYRYALYGVSDVYFVIETSLDKQTLLNWDVVSCIRPDSYLRHNDYSVDGNFDNSPLIENQIIFAEDFYKTLSTPQPRIERTEIKEFTSSGTYTFDKGFPATIEVYALGGGGGGQGGHTSNWINVVVPTTDHGTGGSGGGGGAAYVKFDVADTTTFGVTVGAGGGGGSTFHAGVTTNWESGYSGDGGDSTIVTWNSHTITAYGGEGGGKNRFDDGNRGLSGGSGGGAASDMPGTIPVSGGNGGAGVHKEQRTGQGGKAGRITTGSVNPFPSISGAGVGGNGGYTQDQPGSKGGNGFAVIVVKYYE